MTRASSWGARPDISCRSAIVTVVGDTIAPTGGSFWLGDLIDLVEPFGFSDRLVRTSMYRLGTEGWVDNERIGRRSRYALTTYAIAECAEADVRIYQPPVESWDGKWTLVFPGAAEGQELTTHLHWHGFAELTRGIWGRPNADAAAEAGELFERLGTQPALPAATVKFEHPDVITEGGRFHETSGLALAEAHYREFVDRYAWTDGELLETLAPRDAFLLRTMIVHDFRRARLADPGLPIRLLPSAWIGHSAYDLASRCYGAVADAAWRHVADTASMTVDQRGLQLASRFSSLPIPVATTEDR